MRELTALQNTAILIARIAFVSVFVFQDAFYNKIIHAPRSIELMNSQSLPYVYVLLFSTIILEVAAGFMIISGWRASWGAFLILCFTLIVTIVFHRFWTYGDPAVYQNQLNHFMKNISIMGGAIYIMVFGPGKYTVFH